MFRVIEHLGLLKMDLREAVATKTIENTTLSNIISECKDNHKVSFLESCIDDNESIIEESKATLLEVEQVVMFLESSSDDFNKKDPSFPAQSQLIIQSL